MTFKCDLCGWVFVRQAHLDAHRGRRFCQSRQFARRSSGRGRGAVKRGLGCRGNFQRACQRRVGVLISYLKDNLKRCRGAGPRTEFVPFNTGQVAADVALYGSTLLRNLRARGFDPRAKRHWPVAIATCLASGLFFTNSGCAALGAVPVPWSDSYGSDLATNILKSRSDGRELFNSGQTASKFRSVSNVSYAKARARTARTIKVIKAISVAVHSFFQQRPDLAGDDPSEATTDLFLRAMGVPGVPAYGYTQHLGMAIWRYGGFARITKWTCCSTRQNRMLACNAGCHEGILKCTGTSVRLTPVEARARLGIIARTVVECWGDHGPRVRFPSEYSEPVVLETALASQLCEWKRAGFADAMSLGQHVMIGRRG